MKDILDTLATDGSFSTLLSLLESSGQAGTLRGPGPFTLFAPNEAAFERVNLEEITGDREQLAQLLAYHLVEGKYLAEDIGRDEQLYTSSGKSLSVRKEEGRQVIDNAGYVQADIECTNGVIHVMDNVFLPQFSGWYCSCC